MSDILSLKACIALLGAIGLFLASGCNDQPTTRRLAGSPHASDRHKELYPVPQGCAPGDLVPDPILVGATPAVGAAMVADQFRPILDYLHRRTGYNFQLVMARSYEELVDLMAAGKVHIASISPVSYVKAATRIPCMRLLLARVIFGSPYYKGYIVVRQDSRFRTLPDLKGATLAVPSRSSASGYIFPMAYFYEQGFNPWAHLGRIVFTGDHINALAQVLDGSVDAAATFSGAFLPARLTGLFVSDLRILAITGTIPSDAVCASATLSDQVSRSVAEALRELYSSSTQGRSIMSRVLELSGWVPVRDEFYDAVREKLKLLETRGDL